MPRRRLVFLSSALAATAGLVYFFPLFHIVPLSQARQRPGAASFDPAVFVEQFWTGRLIPGTSKAVDAAQLVAAIRTDRASARKTYGRRVGLGEVYYYFVAGSGRVVSVEKDVVLLSLRDDPPAAQLSLQTGNIFGNAVRDGTGLLNVNDIPNSQDFNAVSSQINQRIEQQVLPNLRKQATVGAMVRFVGCAEVMDEETDLNPLRVVPIQAEVVAP